MRSKGDVSEQRLSRCISVYLRRASAQVLGQKQRVRSCSRSQAASRVYDLASIRRRGIACATRLMNHSVVCRYSPTIPPRLPVPSPPSRPSPESCTSSQVYFHSLRGPLLGLPAAVHKNGQTPIRRSASVSLA